MKPDYRNTERSEMTAAIYRVLLPSAAVIAASLVLAIPGYYGTMTLWYKTGIDRTMLLVGQYCGLTALILIYLQIVIVAGRPLLNRIFGAVNLLRCHRINGAAIAVAAVSHMLLVLVPEGIANLPVGWKFWPEMLGAALLVVVLLVAVTSYFRQMIGLPFKLWRVLHRFAGYLVLVLATTHAVFVSDSFAQTVPRTLVISLFLLVIIVAVAAKFRSTRSGQTSLPN